MSLARHPALAPETVAAVEDLARRCARGDGVAPLSEAFELNLTSAQVTHLTYAASSAHGEALVGYAQRDSEGSAELFVDPAHRREGVGKALLDALTQEGPTRVWAHGDLEGARALAASADLEPVRSLHRMVRAVEPADLDEVALPDGFVVTSFAQRPELDRLQQLNAAAFAGHPEQGRLTVEDLRERLEQPWGDPEGLILLVACAPEGGTPEGGTPEGGTPGGQEPWAAFHWTKIEPGSRTGEVYVVGVAPAYQGRGLAGPLTRLGLRHLARRGVDEVELYVDSDNTRAVRTYERLGFTTAVTDVMYGPCLTQTSPT